VEDATRAGIVVVASAGNYRLNQETGAVGYAGITSPANAPSAVTVGALDMHDTADRNDDTWGNTDLVWDNPGIWSQTVVWGNGLIHTADGSALGPNTVVWGNVH
jgi:subtilisin family serine protease